MPEKILDKKAAVLRATLELIAEQGFHGTPMSQIAQRANIGVGTIYRYFASKEDLINALYLEVKTCLVRHIVRNYSETMPAREGFLVIVHNIIEYFRENPADLLFIEQYANSPLITAANREEGMRIYGPVWNLFKRAQAESLLKDLPLDMISSMTYGAAVSIVKLYFFGAAPDKRTLDAAVEAIWDAIRR
ncbi:MAG TPA: TetR/AcrR family transcriptional regulator [Methylomusa anaerophila]|uniref:HTH-type transcriptional repressor Bm3R1 n=1 Tax=Methylomusa anaerophila TaxID=1930071 RepID=A0A348AI48_9FIRM|nr:TetR/AcrR family transcriptional regulator [Methylomusa anaerophila]BBB90746.1 HTH-type transcriptional repressor Bm3R1 [Methylomusa anaerophila]HML88651.1 TetR/AcrR family transcriptional regulator [Methylomusa anaerophila]